MVNGTHHRMRYPRRSMSRLLPAPLLLCLLALPHALSQLPGAAQPAAPPPVLTLRPVVREVQLDIIVTDAKGHPVKGLKPNDFTLLEDGAPQHFNHFEEHNTMTPEQVARLAPPEKLPPNTFTNYVSAINTNASTVILLDSLDTPIDAQHVPSCNQVVDFPEDRSARHTSIALFSLDTGDVTSSRASPPIPPSCWKPSRSKRDRAQALLAARAPITKAARQFRQDALTQRHAECSARYLAGFPGRKNLLSGSLAPSPAACTDDRTASAILSPDSLQLPRRHTPRLPIELTLSRIAVYPIDARGLASPTPPSDAAHSRGPIAAL